MKYVISLLAAGSNQQYSAIEQIATTDSFEWAGGLSLQSNPCLHNFNLISQPMAKVYRDMDRRHVVVVIKMLKEYVQHRQISVRASANRLIHNWSQAGWNLQKHEGVLYDTAWACLRNSLKNKV